ncbi:MAG: hypothetical protein ACU83V_01845 [Gammaproteobacteria bacterium]
MNRKSKAAAIFALLPLHLAAAASYLPSQDTEVLERLPAASAPANRELRKLRDQLAAHPGEAALALDLAESYIERGKTEADPRYYGYAQGVLKNWWDRPEAPPKVLLLRALIRQNRHDFDGALHDLDTLLKRQPDAAQGWLTRAVILGVQARYVDALQSCAPLIDLDDPLLAGTCLSQASSLIGQAQPSYAFLLDAYMHGKAAVSDEQRQWTLTVLADIAARLGKNTEAERHFAEAAAIKRPNVYLLAAYADFLLDQHQPQKALSLLQDKKRIDALLLRIALAKQQLASNDLAQIVEELKSRFAASRMRGENLHQGDEARFTLHLLKNPEAALQLAKANWLAQREPKDARIFLESALAAHAPDAAQPVIDLLAATGMEHPHLQRLAAELKRRF